PDSAQHKSALGPRSVVDAFATVPRERFVGPGPWQIKSPMRMGDYWTTPDADPRNVYHDALIALDAERGINNGQPSLWIALFDERDYCRRASPASRVRDRLLQRDRRRTRRGYRQNSRHRDQCGARGAGPHGART